MADIRDLGRAALAAAGLLLTAAAPAWAGTTERVSVSSTGEQGEAGSYVQSISADGRFVAFYSDAANLVPGDTNGVDDVFVRDRNGHDQRVSVSSGGAQGDGYSVGPVDIGRRALRRLRLGRHQPRAGRHQRRPDVFVRDRQAGTTERVSVISSGAQGNGGTASARRSRPTGASSPSSDATNLVPGDTNGATDVLRPRPRAETTERVSVVLARRPSE